MSVRDVLVMVNTGQLNSGQIAILELLYKYRFGSRQLLAESLGIKAGSSIHERLTVLVKHGYIGVRLEKHLKLLGKPAAYYLKPKGMRMLQSLPGHKATVKSIYTDNIVSQAFINHTLDVYKYTNKLMKLYPSMKVFTKRSMSQYAYFPTQLPDAFLSLTGYQSDVPKRFFFDLVSDSLPHTALDRRIANYCDFFDSGGWDITGSGLPFILLVSEWGLAERRIQRNARIQLNRSDIEELQVYTSTVGAIEHMDDEGAIWTSVEDSDGLEDLAALGGNP